MPTWHLHIEGQVQGVGFRPFVYQIAQQYQRCGWVNNTTDGLHVVFNGEEEEAETFCHAIIGQAPVLARISNYRLKQVQATVFDQFQIVHSTPSGATNLLISPDFALCPNCRRELHEAGNRRNAYPFITCTHCGPRFSIMQKLPYDRETTTMVSFQMCECCEREYNDPADRRYYSQTNTCPDCTIELTLAGADGILHAGQPDELIQEVVRHWSDGKIVAIKGIGGYLLTCDAGKRESVQELRRRKQRPAKPFAVMYPNIQAVRREMLMDELAEAELLSARSPIVLLRPQPGAAPSICREVIAPGLQRIGVMIPYAPLFELLLRAFGRPVVATSANISKAPIVYEDDKALEELRSTADYLLINNRRIVVPQDDSLVQFTPLKKQKIVLRRSRGMAPTFLQSNTHWPANSILATGAQLKSTFTLLHQQNTYISQYFGDLEHFDTEQSYRHSLQHFLQLLQARPERILIDTHPDYAAAHYGRQLAGQFGVEVEAFQHHQAHFGAILGERQLIDHPETILGVIWDGTGLGDDGMIWGGEFFTYRDHTFRHCGQWEYFDHILGDKMPKEPRISALSASWGLSGAQTSLRSQFSDAEWDLYRKVLQKGSAIRTSSVGRLFDAVASLLGLIGRQYYEGEAAMQLEDLARAYVDRHGSDHLPSYLPEGDLSGCIPTKAILERVLQDLKYGIAVDCIAAGFHFTLVQAIAKVAGEEQVKHIAFNGGVFQNSLLVDLLIHHLGGPFSLYFHEELSPNDENVSFGQLVCHHIANKKKDLLPQNLEAHVLSNSR
ncbi:MAG: carbamoyltransferase HypF [Saprospiraceae bacterium]|nr:carbamoyltransferase HypF [Lewinella sp.]